MKQPELFKMFKPMRFNHRRIAFMGLPLLLSLGMAGYSGWLLWTSFQTTRLVDIAEIAVKEVQSVVKIRTAMNRQVKESLDWYLSGEGYDETQFHHFQKQVLDGITEWLAAAALSSELQTPGEQEEIGGIIIGN